jgi:hypothetical protein
VGKLVRLAALNAGEALNVGCAELPVKFPNTELAACAMPVNVSAGVVVAVATDVVNRGDILPLLNDVTLPAPAAQPTLVTRPPVVVHNGLALAPSADSDGVALNVHVPLTVRVLVNRPVAVPAASKAPVGWNAAVPNAPPAAVVRPAAVVMPDASAVPVMPAPGTVVALMLPVPVTASDAPVPTSMSAVVLVLLVSAENAVAPVLVAVIVTAPTPLVGLIVTLVPAMICVTPPGGAAHAARYAPVTISVLLAQVDCVGAVGVPVRCGDTRGAKIPLAVAVVRNPPAAIELFTNASVARSAVASPLACVVALVPLGRVGVPLRLAAVPVVLTLPANTSALLCAVAAEPAASNAEVG